MKERRITSGVMISLSYLKVSLIIHLFVNSGFLSLIFFCYHAPPIACFNGPNTPTSRG